MLLTRSVTHDVHRSIGVLDGGSRRRGVGRPVAAALFAIVASSVPAVARAGNDDGVLIGNDAALVGGAVTANVRDGTALWYDPAGLARVDRAQADVSTSAFVLRLHALPGLLSSSTGESTDGDHTELVSIAGALTYVRPLGRHVRLGFGLFVPQASDRSARVRLDIVQPEGSLRWVFTVDNAESTYQGAAGLGLRISRNLRVGVALFGVYRNASGHVQLWGGGAATTGEMGFLAVSAIYSLQSVGIEGGLGIQWQPIRELHVGLSVRSPGLELATRLTATTLTGVAGSDAMGMSMIVFEPGEEEALEESIGLRTPARIRLGVAWETPRFTVAAEADVQHALRNDELVVDRRFVWNARVGGRLQVLPTLALGLGLFTDRTADPRPRDFGDAHIDYYGVSAGIEMRTDHRLAPEDDEEEDGDARTTTTTRSATSPSRSGTPARRRARDIVFSSTIGFRYALGIGEVGGLRFDRESNTSVVLIDATVHELTLHLGSGFYF